MTATRDPDRLLRAWLDLMPDEAPDRAIAAVLQQTAHTAQRPRWTFPERWLPMDTTLSRPGFARRLPLRLLIVLALITALVGGALVWYVGSQKRMPAPYGPANNGQLIFGQGGDLYVRDSLTGDARLLLGGPGNQQGVIVSPDGQLIAYDNFLVRADGTLEKDPHEWVANRDGSNPRQVLAAPYTFQAFQWAPDSRSIAIVTEPNPGGPELWIAPPDGSGARQLTFAGMRPWEATWDPQRPGVLLLRAEEKETALADLYYIDAGGTILSQLDMTGLNLNGAKYEFSGAVFSPDGATIAYNSIEARESPVNRFRVHLINRDGTNDRAIRAPLESSYSQAWATFSPDGKWVLMDSWETTASGAVVHQLAIAPADGSAAAKRIGPILEDENQIKMWSPDGSRILLCACASNQLYSVDPVSGDFEKLPWQGDLPGWQRVAR
jgi:Tol biopolymer transport system component